MAAISKPFSIFTHFYKPKRKYQFYKCTDKLHWDISFFCNQHDLKQKRKMAITKKQNVIQSQMWPEVWRPVIQVCYHFNVNDNILPVKFCHFSSGWFKVTGFSNLRNQIVSVLTLKSCLMPSEERCCWMTFAVSASAVEGNY